MDEEVEILVARGFSREVAVGILKFQNRIRMAVARGASPVNLSANCRAAVRNALAEYGIECTLDEVCDVFSVIDFAIEQERSL